MSPGALTYPKKKQSKVNRLNERGSYDTKTIHNIVNTTSVLHVSFTAAPGDFPTVLPMIGQMGSFEDPSSDLSDPLDLYLHGFVSARIMNLARNKDEPLKVGVCATKVDGLVMALTPFSHSYNYRSAVLFGTAEVVENQDEKMYALDLITERVPPDNGEMQSTTVLKITIEAASAKIRAGNPHDDKKDLNNEQVTNRVWTGVVPVYEAFGEPIAAPTNKVKDVPDYLGSYIKERTESERLFAIEAEKEPDAKPKNIDTEDD